MSRDNKAKPGGKNAKSSDGMGTGEGKEELVSSEVGRGDGASYCSGEKGRKKGKKICCEFRRGKRKTLANPRSALNIKKRKAWLRATL